MFHHHKKTEEEDGEYNAPQVYTEESTYTEQNVYGKATTEGYGGHRSQKQEEYSTGEYNREERRHDKLEEYSTGEGYGYNREERRHDKLEDVEGDVKENRRHQHLGTIGAVGAGAYALYEKHEAKKDPEHAYRHKVEAGIGAALSAGTVGYAVHEHHDKEEAKDEYERLEEPEKKHWYN